MASGSYNPASYPQGKWAMSDIYSGMGSAYSADTSDYVSLVTSGTYYAPGSTYPISTKANEWVYSYGNIRDSYEAAIWINGQSMGYADSRVSYSDLDGIIANTGPRWYDYGYIDLNKGINTHDTIYW